MYLTSNQLYDNQLAPMLQAKTTTDLSQLNLINQNNQINLDLLAKTLNVPNYQTGISRFKQAHLIIHYLDHSQHLSNQNYSINELIHEQKYQKLTAQLLMPKPYLIQLIQNLIEQQGLDPKNIKTNQYQTLVNNLAHQLNTSEQGLSNHLRNLHLFTTN